MQYICTPPYTLTFVRLRERPFESDVRVHFKMKSKTIGLTCNILNKLKAIYGCELYVITRKDYVTH